MAGAGYKLFNTGDVLTASDVNTYLQQQVVMVFASSAARTSALSGVLAEGMVTYLQDTNSVQVYNGTAFVAVGGSSPLTTKGDLYTFSTTDARLGVGANGTTLVADSAEATGLKWATPAAGGGMTLITSGSVAASSTGFDLTGISGSFEELKLKVMDIDLNASTLIRFRFNSDAGANYWSYLFGNENATAPTDITNGGTSIGVQYETFSTTANGATIILNLTNYSDTIGFKQFNLQSGYVASSGTNSNFTRFGFWKVEDAITGISLTTSSSSFDAGATFELWGIK